MKLNFSRQNIFPLLSGFGKDVVLATAGIATVALGLLYFNQEKMLYIPQLDEDIPRNNGNNPPGYRSPAEYGIPFEEHYITTADGIAIHSWLLLHPDSESKPTIVFFHGNAGNIGIRLPNAEKFYRGLECNVLMVEYRGYGDSPDTSVKPSETGLKLDGEAAVSFVQNHKRIDPTKIVLFGRSLGGAVAFHVAHKWQARSREVNGPSTPPLAGMIVENTFVSIDEMVNSLFPILSPIKGLLLRMEWNSKSIAKCLTIPILYLAGEADEIVPPRQMNDLFEASKEKSVCARFHSVPGGTHNDTWILGGAHYWQAMQQFIDIALKLPHWH